MTAGRAGRRLLIRAPGTLAAERGYAFDVVVRDWLGLDYELETGPPGQVEIRLAGDSSERALTLPDSFFGLAGRAWLTEGSLPARPLSRATVGGGGAVRTELPILFGSRGAEALWRRTKERIDFALDVFGSAFFMLTRYEEMIGHARDEYDRFPPEASLAVAEGFLDRPLLDEYVAAFWAAVHELWPGLERKPAPLVLGLTHDVDYAWAARGTPVGIVARALATDLLRQHSPGSFARRAVALAASRLGRIAFDPFDTYDFLMETSERVGLRSTFYFMTGLGRARLDGYYDLSDPRLARVLARIHARGHEVGLHAAFDSYRSAEALAAELEALKTACRKAGFEQEAWGIRQHFLRFETPVTWRAQDSAGLTHDSTLGYADEIGFRAGTCREFQTFDLGERRALELRERPLVAMDWTLFSRYRLDAAGAAARVKPLVERCRATGGRPVLLYHNSSLPGRRERVEYRELVEYLARPDEAGGS
jgi:hypothetical protein